MPVLTKIEDPARFNAAEIADAFSRSLCDCELSELPRKAQQTMLDAAQYVLDSLKAQGVLS